MNEQMILAAAEANRVYCAAIGDTSQKPWAEADQWQRDSAVEGVKVRPSGNMTPGAQRDGVMGGRSGR